MLGVADTTPAKSRSAAPTEKVAFVELGNQELAPEDEYAIGLEVTAEDLRGILSELEEHDADVVVFQFRLRNGWHLEAERIAKVLRDEFGPKFRTIAWVRTAGGVASLPALSCEEVYFCPGGRLWCYRDPGGCVLRDWDEARVFAARAADLSGRDVALWNGLLAIEPLSADRLGDGRVRWRNDQSGELKVRDTVQDLVFDPELSGDLGLSAGTAATDHELLDMLGIPSATQVADEASERLRTNAAAVRPAQEALQQTFVQYVETVNNLDRERDRERRASLATEAHRLLTSMRKTVDRYPRFALFVFNLGDHAALDRWYEEQERLIGLMVRSGRDEGSSQALSLVALS